MLRSHLTYANVISTLALFLVLGGGTTLAATGGNFLLGKSNSAGATTQLSSGAASALKVTNTSGGDGVLASGGKQSKGTAAVHGQSGAGNAVEGFSTANPASGVFGQDNKANSYGVAGHSDNGIAVVGDSSNGWAMQALGNATQTRAKSGFVKAMALVVPGGPFAHIVHCFNSQLPPSRATSGHCGITYSRASVGHYDIGFGFRVDDRFVSVTPGTDEEMASGAPKAVPSNKLRVTTFDAFSGVFNDLPFYVIVY
jgi:hypothetical protein